MTRPDHAELLARIPYDPDPLSVREDELVELWRHQDADWQLRHELLGWKLVALFVIPLAATVGWLVGAGYLP